MTRRETHTPAWIAFSYLSFSVAATMAAVFLVHASVSLTKTLRDRHEADQTAAGAELGR